MSVHVHMMTEVVHLLIVELLWRWRLLAAVHIVVVLLELVVKLNKRCWTSSVLILVFLDVLLRSIVVTSMILVLLATIIIVVVSMNLWLVMVINLLLL
jgi:hypothetical protein